MAETSVLNPTSSNGTATAAPSSPPDALADAYEIEPQSAESPATVSDAGNVSPPSPPAPAPAEGGTSDRGPDGRFLPQTHRHPKALIEDASDLGMSADEIAGLDTNTLSMTLRYMRKGLDRERSKEATVDGAMDRNLSQETESVPNGTSPAPAPADDLDIADRDAFDPRFLAVVDKLSKKVKELEGRLGEVTGHLAAQQARTLTERCDAAFRKHKQWLGDKDFADLKPGDPLLTRRQAVYQLAKGMKGGSVEANIDKAVQMMYGSAEPAPPTPPANRISQDDWDAAGLSVPTNRRGDDEPPGPAKAAKSVKKLIDEHRQQSRQDQNTTLADELL